jgi:predicted GTPase
MTAIALRPRTTAADRITQGFWDTADVTWRNLRTLLRTPQALIFATIQPVILCCCSGMRSAARSTSPVSTTSIT